MILPLQISSRNFDLTDAIKADIQEKAEKLNKFYSKIMSCRVMVEAPHRHHQRTGISYNVRIDITVPGTELVVNRENNEDLYVAIRDAFNAARRKLEEFARKQRKEVKHHEVPLGHISSLFLDDGYGFITTLDGREIYFHENSLLNHNFKDLKIGMEVRFAEEMGEKGPQASSVHIVSSYTPE